MGKAVFLGKNRTINTDPNLHYPLFANNSEHSYKVTVYTYNSTGSALNNLIAFLPGQSIDSPITDGIVGSSYIESSIASGYGTPIKDFLIPAHSGLYVYNPGSTGAIEWTVLGEQLD
jgi:hypothetical protein